MLCKSLAGYDKNKDNVYQPISLHACLFGGSMVAASHDKEYLAHRRTWLQIAVHFVRAVQLVQQPRQALHERADLEEAALLRAPRGERDAALEDEKRRKGETGLGAQPASCVAVRVQQVGEQVLQHGGAVHLELLLKLEHLVEEPAAWRTIQLQYSHWQQRAFHGHLREGYG